MRGKQFLLWEVSKMLCKPLLNRLTKHEYYHPHILDKNNKIIAKIIYLSGEWVIDGNHGIREFEENDYDALHRLYSEILEKLPPEYKDKVIFEDDFDGENEYYFIDVGELSVFSLKATQEVEA